MCKNPKIPKIRPDPNFSGFPRCDLRNLKFYQVKPGPTLTRIFGLGFFLGFRGLCCTHYQHTQRGVKKIRKTFAAASTAKLHQHCCCYSAPVKAAAAQYLDEMLVCYDYTIQFIWWLLLCTYIDSDLAYYLNFCFHLYDNLQFQNVANIIHSQWNRHKM